MQNQQTHDRIIDAAVKLFAEHGYNGTATREIARLADVNESSLFRHFPGKQELFLEALRARLGRVRVNAQLQSSLKSAGKPEKVLPLIVQAFVDIATYDPELTQLVQFGMLEMKPATERILQQQLTPIWLSVTDYLNSCIAAGTIRKVDSSSVVIAIAAMIFSHKRFHPVLAGASLPYTNAQEATEAYTKFWLDALLPLGADLARN